MSHGFNGWSGLKSVAAAAIAVAVLSTPASAQYRTFLDQYCVGCHNQRAKTANLMFDTMDLAAAVNASTCTRTRPLCCIN